MKKYKFILAILTFLFTSCEKKDGILNDLVTKNFEEASYIVKDGYLVFKDNASLIKTVDAIINLNNDERKKWEESIGFQS